MYKLGIDLGGTNIVAGVVDENYEIIATAKRKSSLFQTAFFKLKNRLQEFYAISSSSFSHASSSISITR